VLFDAQRRDERRARTRRGGRALGDRPLLPAVMRRKSAARMNASRSADVAKPLADLMRPLYASTMTHAPTHSGESPAED
jgi:hypothetical protein